MLRYLAGILTGVTTCISILLLLWLTQNASASSGAVLGGGEVGEIKRIFSFQNTQNNWRRVTIRRNHVAIPAGLGTLVEISSDASGSNLWFIDDDGILRNLILSPGDLYEVRDIDSVWKEE